jgi:nitrogen PTS system EIIA component
MKETMRICQYLKPELIIPDLKSRNKEEVLTELSDRIAGQVPGIKAEEVLQVLLERERLGSTGVGEGFAIPHGKLKNIDQMIIAFGRSGEGISFNSMDGKEAYYFFVLIAPENSAGLHLTALAKISRFLRKNTFRESLSRASDRETILKAIQEQDDLI